MRHVQGLSVKFDAEFGRRLTLLIQAIVPCINRELVPFDSD